MKYPMFSDDVFPKVGIRPTIDGRRDGVREALEEQTMDLARFLTSAIAIFIKSG